MPKLDKTRWPVLGALAVIIAGFVLVRSRRPLEAVSTTVRPAAAIDSVLATGRVVGEKTIPLSFLRPGRIAVELVQDGDAVRAGQVLMVQEKDQAETDLAARRNALALARLAREKLATVDVKDLEQRVRQTKAAALYADDYLERQTQLFKQNSIPSLQLEQAKRDRELAGANYEAAKNQLDALLGPERELAELQVARAETDLRRAEIDLGETSLRAPFDGRVVGHEAHRGEYVGAGQAIINFIPAAPHTYVEIQVDEIYSGKFATGQRATVASPAFPGRAYPAAIERIAPIVDTQRGTFTVRLALAESHPELLPESSVSVQVVIGDVADALLLEQRFLVFEGRDAFAFTAERGRARRRAVSVHDLGSGRFKVDAGLKAGDTVLLPQRLKDGMRVKPVPAAG